MPTLAEILQREGPMARGHGSTIPLVRPGQIPPLEMSARQAPFSENLRGRVGEIISGMFGTSPRSGFAAADQLVTGAEFTPGVGTALGVADVLTDPQADAFMDLPEQAILGGPASRPVGSAIARLGQNVERSVRTIPNRREGEPMHENVLSTARMPSGDDVGIEVITRRRSPVETAGADTRSLMRDRDVVTIDFDVNDDMLFSSFGRSREGFRPILATVQNEVMEVAARRNAEGRPFRVSFTPATDRLGQFYRTIAPRLARLIGGKVINRDDGVLISVPGPQGFTPLEEMEDEVIRIRREITRKRGEDVDELEARLNDLEFRVEGERGSTRVGEFIRKVLADEGVSEQTASDVVSEVGGILSRVGNFTQQDRDRALGQVLLARRTSSRTGTQDRIGMDRALEGILRRNDPSARGTDVEILMDQFDNLRSQPNLSDDQIDVLTDIQARLRERFREELSNENFSDMDLLRLTDLERASPSSRVRAGVARDILDERRRR